MSPKRGTSIDHWLERNANFLIIEIIENFNRVQAFWIRVTTAKSLYASEILQNRLARKADCDNDYHN